MGKYTLVVLTNPVEGREDEYNDWYSNEHLQDVVAVPGYSSAQRFATRIPMIGESKHRYLALYDMDVDSPQGVVAAGEALQKTEMRISEALDLNVALSVYETILPRRTNSRGESTGTFRIVVFSNPVPGREAEYTDWYENTHIPDMLGLPGVTAAQRLKLHQTQTEMPAPYLAVYELAANSPEEAGALLKRIGEAKLPSSDASDLNQTLCAVFEVCSARVEAPKEKAIA
jgi:hypothetical protein